MSQPCKSRGGAFSQHIDHLDSEIARLVKQRQEWMKDMPSEYDSCGEGEIYFGLLGLDYGERVYHAIAGIK